MDRETDTYSSSCNSNGNALGVAPRQPVLVECFPDYGISGQTADHFSDAAYVVPTVTSVPGRPALDHVQLMNYLGWEPLTTRSRNMRLCMMYKIAHTVVGGPWTEWLTTTK